MNILTFRGGKMAGLAFSLCKRTNRFAKSYGLSSALMPHQRWYRFEVLGNRATELQTSGSSAQSAGFATSLVALGAESPCSSPIVTTHASAT